MESGNNKNEFANLGGAETSKCPRESQIDRLPMFKACQGRGEKRQRLNVSFLVRKSLRLLIAVLIIVGWCGPAAQLLGQNNAKVLTTDAGVQFDGSVFTIQQISETSSPYEPFGNNAAIAVVDDGLRRIFLNPNHLDANLGDSDRLKGEIVFETDQKAFNPNGSVGRGTFVSAGQFNQYGHRVLSVRTPQGIKRFVQGITKITPRYVSVSTLVGGKAPKQWEMQLARGTIPKEVLRQVLRSNIEDKTKPDEFLDIAFFWQQVGDFEQASKELLLIESTFPNLKERIAERREELGQLKAQQILREIRMRTNAGQPGLSRKLAAVTPQAGLAGEIQEAFRDVEQQALKSEEALQQSRKTVFDLIENIKNLTPDQLTVIDRFKAELESDLNAVNVLRLDGFLNSADDASTPNSQKIALAISGWILGSNNADPNLAVAQSMFRVRDLVQEYLTQSTTKLRRSQILNELATIESGTPPILDALIKQLNPIEPTEAMDDYTSEKPLEFTVEIPGTKANPDTRVYRCLAHLPPEYDPYRRYPLILSLPGGNQTLEQNLNIWCGPYNPALQVRAGHAMRNGYVVVAVDWRDAGQSRWQYSAREHAIITKALRSSLRRFSINSDRVFLSGHGIGGDGAYDVGLSHPEHWAGVLGFSGSFGKYLDKYIGNKHVQLPVYCVNGQKHYGAIRASKDAQNKWIRNKGYPDVTVVHYIGRANELLIEEIPEAFKWMRPQKRYWPDNAGFKFECDSLRPWDSYFWFFEMYGIPEANVVRPALFDTTKKFNKLKFAAELKGNSVRLEPRNPTIKNNSTFWLSPEYVDFSKRFEIRGRGQFKGQIFPSREVLLNDVLRRGDREHPFWGRIDHVDGAWKAKGPIAIPRK